MELLFPYKGRASHKCSMVLWCSGLALETLNLASWVRIPVRPILILIINSITY